MNMNSLSGQATAEKNNSNFHVCVRVRPTSTPSFYSSGHQESTKYIRAGPENSILLMQPHSTQGDKVFIYDEVFDNTSRTKEIFDKVVLPNISDSLFKGFSHTILVYGMTGSGKTFTMFGENCSEPITQTVVLNLASADAGVYLGAQSNIRASNNVDPIEVDGPLRPDECVINDSKEGLVSETVKFVLSHHSENSKIKLKMSYLEIYNESVRDLLQTDSRTSENLMILEDPDKGVHCPLLSQKDISSLEQISQLIKQGNKRRVMASTKINQFSSRSHAIIQLSIEMEIENDGKMTTFFTPKLYMVDLAGSERASATESKGIRLKEGGNINKSLLSLGNCITILSQQGLKYQKSNFNYYLLNLGIERSKQHVPYRDSKLTRLLKESLGGNAKTLFIACVTPAFKFVEETINTLKYAQRAKSIQKEVYENVKQIYNQIEKAEQMKEIQSEIETLKDILSLNNDNGIMGLGLDNNEDNITDEDIRQRLQGLSNSNINSEEIVKSNQLKTQKEIFADQFAKLSEHFEDILFRSRELESNLEEYNQSREQNEKLVHEIMDTINPTALHQKDMKYRLDKVNMLRTIIKHNDEVIIKLQRELIDNDKMKVAIKKELGSLYEVKFIKECQQLSNFQLYSSFEQEKKRLQEQIDTLITDMQRDQEEVIKKDLYIEKLKDEMAYIMMKAKHNETLIQAQQDQLKQRSRGRGKQLNLRSSMFIGGTKATPRNLSSNNGINNQVASKYLQFQTFVPSSNISVNTVRGKSANLRNSMYNPARSSGRSELEPHDPTNGAKSMLDVNNLAGDISPQTREYEEYKRKEYIIETQLKSVQKPSSQRNNGSRVFNDPSVPFSQQNYQSPSKLSSQTFKSFKSSFVDAPQCNYSDQSYQEINTITSLPQEYLRKSECKPKQTITFKDPATEELSNEQNKRTSFNNIQQQTVPDSQKSSFSGSGLNGLNSGNSPFISPQPQSKFKNQYSTQASSSTQQSKTVSKHSKNPSYQSFDDKNSAGCNGNKNSSSGYISMESHQNSNYSYQPIEHPRQNQSLFSQENNQNNILKNNNNSTNELLNEQSNFLFISESQLSHNQNIKSNYSQDVPQTTNKNPQYSTPNNSHLKQRVAIPSPNKYDTKVSNVGTYQPVNSSYGSTSINSASYNQNNGGKQLNTQKVNSISSLYSPQQPINLGSQGISQYNQFSPSSSQTQQILANQKIVKPNFNNFIHNQSYGGVPSPQQNSPSQQQMLKVVQVPTTAITLNLDMK